jgi:maltooligosyltrehalose trehalohydrolase
MDALWNDDYHHVARVILTGHNEAYYVDYTGTPQELISAVKWGYLYQGQHYRWHNGRRGASALDLPARVFVNYLQNHDQIANSGYGDRIHALAAPGDYRALTALTLLAPGTPLLFQGQEFAASSPFLYFADHEPELSAKVDAGRKESLAVFPSLGTPEVQAIIANPADEATFLRCKLDWSERESHAAAYRLHRDLLRLRREDPVFSAQDRDRMHGAVLAPAAFALRFLGNDGDDRLMLVNLGRDLHLDPSPEPLLAPPAGGAWKVLWSSEHPDYGAFGTVVPDSAENWRIRGHATVVLAPGGDPVEAEYAPGGGDPEERERKLEAEP